MIRGLYFSPGDDDTGSDITPAPKLTPAPRPIPPVAISSPSEPISSSGDDSSFHGFDQYNGQTITPESVGVERNHVSPPGPAPTYDSSFGKYSGLSADLSK